MEVMQCHPMWVRRPSGRTELMSFEGFRCVNGKATKHHDRTREEIKDSKDSGTITPSQLQWKMGVPEDLIQSSH